jgi:HlyD family secretion protein
MKRFILIVLLLGAAGAGTFAVLQRGGSGGAVFRTVTVKRADLRVTIAATGTVEPEEVVDVGAQVAGKVASFGEDPHNPGQPIDYGSEVEEGTVLARIDDALYLADVASTSAQWEQAKANVTRAKADLDSKIAAQAQADAGVELAQITLDHLKLIPRDTQSNIEFRTAEATLAQAQAALATAKANVEVAEASVLQAEKAVMQQEAALGRSKTNLGYCTIRSPVKGAIIDRRVNIGQTVVSSLNAPSLFLIAKDLKRMEVWASVNEADIGKIHPGQKAYFTVDTFPGHTFIGQVGKIRLNAAMTQNVVTYTVEIITDNSDGMLLPYLTANVQFDVAELDDVLAVPNAALRWTPPAERIALDARSAENSPGRSGQSGRSGGGSGSPARTSDPTRDVIWVADGSFVRPVPVKVGLTDGTQTQIEGDGVREGMEVVIGEAAKGAASAPQATNPFAPQLNRGRRGQ